MQFDWWTFGLQVINFAILVWLLQKFLYRPVRDIIRERRELVEKKQAEAAKLQHIAEQHLDELDKRQKAFDADREERIANLKRELGKRRIEAQAKLQKELTETKDTARKEISSERRQALIDLQSDIVQLARAMAEKILLEHADQLLNAAAPLKTALNALSPVEKDRIVRDLAIDNAEIRVITAAPLKPDQQKSWRQQLCAFTGAENSVLFETNVALIAGAEVRFPHAALKVNMAASLQKLTESINKNENAHQ